MAYRRRPGMSRSSTFKEEAANHKEDKGAELVKRSSSFSSSTLSPLATQAIHTSIAQSRDRDPPLPDHTTTPRFNLSHECHTIEEEVEHSDSKSGFWGILARKAKAILEEENASEQFDDVPGTAPAITINTSRVESPRKKTQSHHRRTSHSSPRSRKGLEGISTPTLNALGDSFDRALEAVRTPRESKTPDNLHGTRKLRIRRKGIGMDGQSLTPCANMSREPGMLFSTQLQHNQENQLKASRDVAMATAAKAKILLRELKTVKADLAFAKERCAQLEEENRFLRAREKGDDLNPADDDLIRLQLETLLAEKARLANENSIYARENRYLREIVEYHQLTMQDILYLDEGDEDDSEVELYPLSPLSPSEESLSNPDSPQEVSSLPNSPLSIPNSPQEVSSSIPNSPQEVSSSILNSPLSIPNSPQDVSSSIPYSPREVSQENKDVSATEPNKVEGNDPSFSENKDESSSKPNKVEGNSPAFSENKDESSSNPNKVEGNRHSVQENDDESATEANKIEGIRLSVQENKDESATEADKIEGNRASVQENNDKSTTEPNKVEGNRASVQENNDKSATEPSKLEGNRASVQENNDKSATEPNKVEGDRNRTPIPSE